MEILKNLFYGILACFAVGASIAICLAGFYLVITGFFLLLIKING